MICRSCRALARGVPRAAASPRIIATSSSLLRKATASPSLLQPLQGFSSRAFSQSATLCAGTTQSAPTPEALSMTPAENAIAKLLETALTPTHVLVKDVSGGCGSMYAIEITSEAFRGQSVLKQQRMVNKALEGVMGDWHGVQIRTSVPDSA